jgi:hypothetical protein
MSPGFWTTLGRSLFPCAFIDTDATGTFFRFIVEDIDITDVGVEHDPEKPVSNFHVEVETFPEVNDIAVLYRIMMGRKGQRIEIFGCHSKNDRDSCSQSKAPLVWRDGCSGARSCTVHCGLQIIWKSPCEH